MSNIFEAAARKKYRFPFKGMIATEDLFDLRVEDLDVIFKSLNAQVKKQSEESLLMEQSKMDEDLANKIEIVKYIFNSKVEEANARAKAAEVKAQKQKIMSIMAAKQEKSLQDMSMEALQKMLEALDK